MYLHPSHDLENNVTVAHDCREQGIRKVEKCLQTRLSTTAEHSCKRDVQLRILFVPMGKEHFLHTRMFL